MIFLSQINKILSGNNLSLFAISDNQMELFIFNNGVTKNLINFDSNKIKCTPTNNKYNYNKVSKINDTFLCLCFDDNISVIKNEKI